MKKCMCLLLAVAVLLCISVNAFAISNNRDEGDKALAVYGEGCFVSTLETPRSIKEYAAKIFPVFFSDYMVANNKDFTGEVISLGSPINIQEADSENRIYHFPVMQGGNFVMMLSVYSVPFDDGTYPAQLMPNRILENLSELKSLSSLDHPIEFISDENGLHGEIKTSIFDTENNKTEMQGTQQNSENQMNIVDVTAPITEIVMHCADTIAEMRSGYGNPLTGIRSVPQTLDGTFNYTEENSRNWCGAAMTASIINYKCGKSLSAKDITKAALGSVIDAGITNRQIIDVAGQYNLSPTSGNPLSYTNVKTEINAGRPIYMQMQRPEGTEKKYHALTLIGYDSTTYTVLNPWFAGAYTIAKNNDGSQVTYFDEDGYRTYTWSTSIYNWSRK